MSQKNGSVRPPKETAPGLKEGDAKWCYADTDTPPQADAETEMRQGDYVARPEHPIYKGVLYAMPALVAKRIDLMQSAFDKYEDDRPLLIALLAQRLENALHALAIFETEAKRKERELQRAQQKAQRAQERYCREAAEIMRPRDAATREIREKIAALEAELTTAHEHAARACACVVATPYNPANPREALAVPTPSAAEVAGELRLPLCINAIALPLRLKEPFRFLAGSFLGLSISMEQGYLFKSQIQNLDAESAPLAVFFALLGWAIFSFLSTSVESLWRHTGRLCALQTDQANWIRVAIAAALTFLPGMTEAAIIRNVKANAYGVVAPTDIGYWLSALPVILACTLYAGVAGWTQGQSEASDLCIAAEIAKKRGEEEARRFATPEGAEALYRVGVAEMTKARYEAALAEEARIAKPYNLRLDRLEKEMDGPTDISARDRLLLDGLRADAIAASVRFLNACLEAMRILEGIRVRRAKKEAYRPTPVERNALPLPWWRRLARWLRRKKD